MRIFLMLSLIFSGVSAFAKFSSREDSCHLSNVIELPSANLLKYETVIKGQFKNLPNETFTITLAPPEYVGHSEGKERGFIDLLSISIKEKPSVLTEDRMRRMSFLFDSQYFIKFTGDVSNYGYQTIFNHRLNPQPSPYFFSSSLFVTNNQKGLTSLVFVTPKSFRSNKMVTLCLVNGALVSQTPIRGNSN